jgi:GNAT superfamily N-acetyltransferase
VIVERVELATPPSPEPDLAALLLDAVADGASVGFLEGLTPAQAADWWAQALRGPGTLTWVCRDGAVRAGPAAAVLGVVQLHPAPQPNGAHRAEVSKLLVLRSARGRGVARALLATLEAEAAAMGRWRLVLDTRTGSLAETLYQRWGWHRVGTIEDYAADPDGRLAPTTIMTKDLRRSAASASSAEGSPRPRPRPRP